MPCCDTGRNIQKYKGAAASTLQDVTDNGNTTTGDIITTSGFFIGDGSLLTGIAGASSAFSFQDTSDRGNTTSNTIQFTNPITSLTTSGNVIVAGNVTASKFYGLGTGISEIDPNSLTSAVSISKGGTGSTTTTGAASALGVGTEDSPQFTGIKLGHASDTTLLRSSPGVVTIQGQTIRTGDVALGTQTSGNYVKTITAGDGLDMSGTASQGSDHTLSLDLKANHGLVIDNTELKIDLKTSGGLEFDSGQMRVKLDDTSINGTLPVGKGGTGATTLDNLISLGSHTTGNYVKTITAGNGLDMSGSASQGSDHTLSLDLKANHGLVIDNTELKIDLKTSGGLEFDSGQMRVKLDDTSINGTLPASKGGTGLSSGFTHGDILFVNSSGTFSKLGADSGKYLKSRGNDTDPIWASVTEEAAATAGSLTAGDGLTSDQGAFNGSTNTVFSIDLLSGGGLVFDGTGTNNKKLKVDLTASGLSALPVNKGGTGATAVTGTGDNVLSTSPTLTGTTSVTNISASGNIVGVIAGSNTISGTTITASSKFVGHVNESGTAKNVFGSTITAGSKFVGDVNESGSTKNVFGSTITASSKFVGHVNESGTAKNVFGSTITAGSKFVGDVNESGSTKNVFGSTITGSTKLVGDVNEANTTKNVFGNTITVGTGGLSVGGDINLTGKIKINGGAGNATQVLTSGGSGGVMTWADAGAATNYWVRSGSSPNYIVTTPTPQSNVGISNTYEVKHTLNIGSNVIVSDTGGHDVLRVNGNVFCTNYLFGDGSKIRNLNTIRTETGSNQISLGSDDGGPVLSWRERQIRYQRGSGRPDPPNYGF